MGNEKSRHDATPAEKPSLADRADAMIRQAEIEFRAAKSELATAALTAVQGKKEYEALHRLTTPIKNLAPLIRNEVSSLERLWRQAEERKEKLTDSCEAASKELKSVSLAREQLKQIGLYASSNGTFHAALSAVAR